MSGVLIFSEFSVEEIVNSYEKLSAIEKKKIISIAKQRIKELCLTSFDRQYRYIAWLVENWMLPEQERAAIRLDAPINSWDISGDSFTQLFGKEDSQLKNLFEDSPPETQNKVLSMREIFSILENEMEEPNLVLLKQLAGNKRTVFYTLSREKLLAMVPEIQTRVTSIGDRYKREDKLLLPKRPIKWARFRETGLLEIKFNPRDWQDIDALAFFRKYEDIYGGMSRKELWNFDRGLYSILREKGQLEEAIPEVDNRGRSVPTEEIRKIIEGYPICQGNASEAARNLGWSHKTILKYWKETGFKSQNRTGERISPEVAEKIRKAHSLGMGQNEAAAYSGVSNCSVFYYWKEAGLEPHYKKGWRRNFSLPTGVTETIIDRHRVGMLVEEIAKYVEKEPFIVAMCLKKAGLQPCYERENASQIPLPFTPALIEKLKESHRLRRTPSKAALYIKKETGIICSPVFIENLWDKLELEPWDQDNSSSEDYFKNKGRATPSDIMMASEVSTYLKLNMNRVYELARKELIPGVKFGREWRFKKTQIEELSNQSVY